MARISNLRTVGFSIKFTVIKIEWSKSLSTFCQTQSSSRMPTQKSTWVSKFLNSKSWLRTNSTIARVISRKRPIKGIFRLPLPTWRQRSKTQALIVQGRTPLTSTSWLGFRITAWGFPKTKLTICLSTLAIYLSIRKSISRAEVSASLSARWSSSPWAVLSLSRVR